MSSLFNLSNRIYGMVVLLLLVIMGVAAIGIWKMDKIGGEIEAIAEQDIPLTEIFTKITINQLEQAILLEKVLGSQLEHDNQSIAKKFSTLGHTVDDQIKEAEHMLVDAIKFAHSEKDRKEFIHLLEIMEEVEVKHASYEEHGEQAFKSLAEGDNVHAKDLMIKAEHEQEYLDKVLISALSEIEEFTKAAAIKAEHDEKAGLKMLIIASVGGIVFGAIASFLVVSSIVKPINCLTKTMNNLSGGDLETEVQYTQKQCEVGEMARSVEIFKENALEVKRLEKLQKEAEAKMERERKKLLETLASEIEVGIGKMAENMTFAADSVKGSAQDLSSSSAQASNQSAEVANASENAASNVQTVATASQELAASVLEIGRQVSHSTQKSYEAVETVESANTLVHGLSQAADKIGEVITLIGAIAEQTNLLALNATIEANRAGETGKGFAVVASEVKGLANQTANATEEISQQVKSMQEATFKTVNAMGEIEKVIQDISNVSNSIAAAVEEQSAATDEIARNVQEAAQGTESVNCNIADIAKVAEHTGSSAQNLLTASNDMGRDSALLKDHVYELAVKVRNA